MRSLWYTLARDNRTPVEADWPMDDRERGRVGLDVIGETEVSTVFLGLDHSTSGVGPLVLWETMVFGGPLDGEQERYSSWAEAVDGHNEMLTRVYAEVGMRGIRL